MTMRRRDAIKTLGGLAGAAAMARFLPGCGDNGDSGPVGITNYVFLMLENRSYDHYFGARAFLENKGGDGPDMSVTLPDLQGNPVSLFNPTLDKLCDPDPPHGWDALHASWNNGACDGFVQQHQMQHAGAIDPMQYLTRDDLPVSWALADNYTTCDRWFASMMGPTYPNRFYWMLGTSNGQMDNVLPTDGIPSPSIFNQIDNKGGIDWAYYYGSIPVVTALNAPGSQYELDLGPDDDTGRVRTFFQFMNDCNNGTLPPIVYIDPFFYENDDHPPIHPINGQELIAAIYTSLAKSRYWKNCMLVVTYDECGGFYDHVSPPTTADDFASTGFDRLGFRVPAMVIGPYAKQGYVSSVQYDHTSALKHLINTFELDNINMRTAAATDLTDCIDMDRLAAGEPADPIELPEVDVSKFPMPEECRYSGDVATYPQKDPISEWANANQARIGRYDRRKYRDQYRSQIRNFLLRARRG